MRQCRVYRGILYVAGLLILALGLTLNTKTGLGTSPINGCENYSFAYRDYRDWQELKERKEYEESAKPSGFLS